MNIFLLPGFKLVRDPEFNTNSSEASMTQNLESLAVINEMSEGCASVAATVMLGNVPSEKDVSPVINAAAILSGLV